MEETSPHRRLRAVRERLGLSEEAFGQSIGVSQATVSALELGKRALKDPILRAIESVYRISRDWLLTGAGEATIATDLSAAEHHLVRVFRGMAEDDRGLFMQIGERLVRAA